MKEVVLREQFKKWKASYFFEGVDEAAWCTEFHTHFDAIPGFDSTDAEQLRALHVTLREQLPAGELVVEAFDEVRLDVVSFQKKYWFRGVSKVALARVHSFTNAGCEHYARICKHWSRCTCGSTPL
jgi:hypothetical protein